MTRRNRKLVLVQETVRRLSTADLGAARGGTSKVLLLNYKTSYAVRGCQSDAGCLEAVAPY